MEADSTAMKIEEIFASLEEMTAFLERGDTPLEEAFVLYERGMEMLREAAQRIDTVEKKIAVIAESMQLSDRSETHTEGNDPEPDLNGMPEDSFA